MMRCISLVGRNEKMLSDAIFRSGMSATAKAQKNSLLTSKFQDHSALRNEPINKLYETFPIEYVHVGSVTEYR